MNSFAEFLQSVPVCLADGAMGTELLRRGYPQDAPLELANLTHPELVRRVHEEYISSGAQVIETNTFGANSLKLSASGLENKTEEIIRAGVALAREVARGKAYVLGSIGPLGKPVGEGFGVRDETARECYQLQIEAFLRLQV
ncbi:MAG: homocysteine S-methyltransferase family protein [Treponemataceae bacterium]|nr:homocysteine S-methyltransferase family protein [Treponemataceae bacterium]